jgi:hypothetical protein
MKLILEKIEKKIIDDYSFNKTIPKIEYEGELLRVVLSGKMPVMFDLFYFREPDDDMIFNTAVSAL